MKNSKNNFSIIWGVSIVLLFAFCIFGITIQTKGTSAADVYSLSGQWRWKEGNLTPPGDLNNNSTNMNWTSGDNLHYAFDGTEGPHDGPNYTVRDYRLSYTDNFGTNYQSLTLFRYLVPVYYVVYDTSYVASDSARYVSGDDTTAVIKMEVDMDTFASSETTWLESKGKYQTIDFGSTKQTVSKEFYIWFLQNAEEVNKCYYDYSSSKFVWTNITSTGVVYPEYDTKEKCGENTTTEYKLSGKWKWNDGDLIPPGGLIGNTTNMTWGYACSDCLLAGVKYDYADYHVRDYKLNYTDNNGVSYQSLTLFAFGEMSFHVAYDTSYKSPVSGSYLYDSKDGVTAVIRMYDEANMFENYETTWLVDKTQYQTIDFGETEQPVTKEFYIWFLQNASPVEINYVINYDANGGTGAPLQQSSESKEIQLRTEIPTNTGYVFVKWNDKIDGTGSSYNPGDVYNKISDVTLYAQWGYEITYDANGGTSRKTSDKVVANNQTKLPSANLKDYRFVGWYTEKTGGEYVGTASSKYTVTKNITLYARYEKIFSVDEDKYNFDEDNKIIFIGADTVESEFKKNVTVSSNYILEVDKKSVDGKDMLYTGGKVKLLTQAFVPVEEYKVAVKGDIDGNGKVSMLDYVKIYRHLSPSFDDKLEDVYALAADFDNNGEIKMLDYAKIYDYIKSKQGNN